MLFEDNHRHTLGEISFDEVEPAAFPKGLALFVQGGALGATEQPTSIA